MTAKSWDHVLTNARLVTMAETGTPYGLIEDGAIGVKGDRIAWIGPMSALRQQSATTNASLHDTEGRCITPGLIDCHTHLVYGGSRAREFERRLEGATYEEIARAGGGIRSTVAATRALSEDALYEASRPRLEVLLAEGVTTVEIKSGYGLDTASEAKSLRVARRLGRDLPVTVATTFLGAHALPPEYAGRSDDFIEAVVSEMLPAVAREHLADAVDAFCEGIGFTPAQVERVFQAARSVGLPMKLHAEQLSNLGGAALAARYGALSADHLEYIDEPSVQAMAAAGTVAVLLPGAFYFLREKQLPPIDLFHKHGVPIAISTDCNPGTSPVTSLLLMLNMACTLFRMTPEQALAGVTRNAARALGLGDRGTLEAGKLADFVVWDIEEPAELSYRFGCNPVIEIVQAGVPRHAA
ncbi:MAG TPA: imidazolonepropionase [Stellaceae bacterium]|nr:imidazolonepropionase [Stellaceae bacterium]